MIRVSDRVRVIVRVIVAVRVRPASRKPWPADLIQLARVGMLSAQFFLLMATK